MKFPWTKEPTPSPEPKYLCPLCLVYSTEKECSACQFAYAPDDVTYWQIQEIEILKSAAVYLQLQPESDAISEAIDLIDDARSEVEHEYQCPVCTNMVIRKGIACSRNCAKAMADDAREDV